MPESPKEVKDHYLSCPGLAISTVLLDNVGLYIENFQGVPYSDEDNTILMRFGKVFQQTYTRFLDLQKAEAQTREAQIEGALERVRSKTMAMHNSEDLEDIVISLFGEVLNLGLDKSIRCGIGILEGNKGMETRSVNSNSDGTVELRVGMLNMTIHPMLVGLKKAWKNGSTEYSYDYTGKDVRKYYKALNNEPEYPFNANLETLPEREFHRSFFFSSGILFTFSEAPISEESSKLLARFAAVFGQTYRRFLDLQQAEDRAKDAVKQASLDRVRGEIASMRSTEDLQRITPLVFNELTSLGVPFFRCGVFIIHEKEKKLEVYLSAPDGHSLGVLHLPFNVNSLTQNAVENWTKNKVYHQHWNKEDFVEWTQSMLARGQIKDADTYQGAAAPPDSLDLHFIPFSQGMLYVGNIEQLEEDDIDLVRSLAETFSIAYARYEDFTKLENAKESIETTLTELKATQNQLVQSEKMASLGELTAGIAHEIQNPLNFVNNFSEVSVELIEEMNEELKKGDLKEAQAIAEDVKQNLDKITHHGKRADGIVKGMLQHSRSSSGQKEPTDINVLADEYLRLAYHGLRAKDKTFSATMETDFDESIDKINVIPQDIGRVILNLITNAFYVVSERKLQQPNGYEPTVSVKTKKNGNQVLISVKDNGKGIPQKVLEKIFQPFFTTKPTGEGTGLGLSMSYDIVKAHGGELKVETNEGEGSQFIIILPV
nr:ATP-binding protein [uncultured Eudoraea sp.]